MRPRNKKQLRGQRSLKNVGLAYQIDFAAADPDLYTTPIPYPEKIPKADLIIGRGNGEAIIPLAKFNDGSSTGGERQLLLQKALDSNVKVEASIGKFAKVNANAGVKGGDSDVVNANVGLKGGDSDVKVESLMPEHLYLGQIVPFEIKISVSGSQAPEDGNITFTAGWSTETTSGGDFGYDKSIGVLAAFVDTGDGAHNDPSGDASVSSFSWSIVNKNEIQGVFDITGLDDGDEVVVEVWVVINNIFPSAGATGNVHSRLLDATTSQGDTISTGRQTIPMMALNKGGPADGSEFRFAISSLEDDLFCG
jgi:hypothetical protein